MTIAGIFPQKSAKGLEKPMHFRSREKRIAKTKGRSRRRERGTGSHRRDQGAASAKARRTKKTDGSPFKEASIRWKMVGQWNYRECAGCLLAADCFATGLNPCPEKEKGTTGRRCQRMSFPLYVPGFTSFGRKPKAFLNSVLASAFPGRALLGWAPLITTTAEHGENRY